MQYSDLTTLLEFNNFQLRPRLRLQLQLQLRPRPRPLHDTSHVPDGADICHKERQWAKQPENREDSKDLQSDTTSPAVTQSPPSGR